MNVSRLNLRMLFEFEAIHRLGSLTAAGDALGLSQPALSHALTRMRATFDDALFVRTSHGLRPTPRADELAARARRILAFVHAELATIAPFDPGALERVFTVGMSDVAQMVFLPKLISRFRLEAPHCDLTAVSLRPRELAEALEAGTVDLAVGPFPDLAGSSLRSEPLFERGFRCLLSAEHPRIRRPKITMEQFIGEVPLGRFIARARGTIFRRLLEGAKTKTTHRNERTTCALHSRGDFEFRPHRNRTALRCSEPRCALRFAHSDSANRHSPYQGCPVLELSFRWRPGKRLVAESRRQHFS